MHIKGHSVQSVRPHLFASLVSRLMVKSSKGGRPADRDCGGRHRFSRQGFQRCKRERRAACPPVHRMPLHLSWPRSTPSLLLLLFFLRSSNKKAAQAVDCALLCDFSLVHLTDLDLSVSVRHWYCRNTLWSVVGILINAKIPSKGISVRTVQTQSATMARKNSPCW